MSSAMAGLKQLSNKAGFLGGCLVLAVIAVAAVALATEPQAAERESHSRRLLNVDFYDVPQLRDVDAGPWQIVALVFMGLCLTLAAAGGVGGGPMLVSNTRIMKPMSITRRMRLLSVIRSSY